MNTSSESIRNLISDIFAGDEPDDQPQKSFCEIVERIATCADANLRHEIAGEAIQSAYRTTNHFRESLTAFNPPKRPALLTADENPTIEVQNEQ